LGGMAFIASSIAAAKRPAKQNRQCVSLAVFISVAELNRIAPGH
jgi:hypothetical protein